MTYKTIEIASWVVKSAQYLEDNKHTDYDRPCTLAALADACEFPQGQWARVKQAMLQAGYTIAVRSGKGGGFYLGEQGSQASHLVLTEKYVEARLGTTQRQEQALKPIGWDNILRFAKNQLAHDLGLGARRISAKAMQLALPAPDTANKGE